MSINLTKSKGISLEKGLSKVKFTVSWDTKADVDIECLVLKDGKAEDSTITQIRIIQKLQ